LLPVGITTEPNDMATSSILGGDRAPLNPSGRDTDALGPSDSSDSGSDVQGERGFDALDDGQIGGDRADLRSDSDASGTGERGSAVNDSDIVEGADIAPDRIGVIDGATDDLLGDEADIADVEALAADDDAVDEESDSDTDR
jgi:hypothetical protein